MRKKIYSILALLLTVTQGAWALSGSGTQADPYLITSASDWNQLVSSTTYFGSGKYYRLTYDISVTSPVSRGASLQGTFDGNGHTITLTYSTSTKYDGLFPSIENLTVKNLHVAGTITTSNECAAGIAGKALGTNYFKNCRVSITISSSLSGKGYHGGLVAAVQGSGSANHVYIDNCSFDGGLTGHNTSYWCGFIGWSDYLNHVSISNSYFRPRNLNVNTDDFHPFSHVQQTYTNCLYTFYYSNQTPGDYSSEEGISSSASLSAYDVKNTLGSDNWKSVTESSVEYVVPIWQYTIFFDANGGSGAPAAQTKKDGTDLTLSSDVPTREGYNFFKWNTKADGTGINYAAGETYTVNTGVTLYAKWTPVTYTATFAAGNDSEGWTIDPTSGVEGTTVTVSYSGENKVKSVTVQAKP